MPFKKLDENEQRQVKDELVHQDGPVTYLENPYLENDEVILSNEEVYYVKFGRTWDPFDRMFRSFEEACKIADSTRDDIQDTCTVYSNRKAGPQYSAYKTQLN